VLASVGQGGCEVQVVNSARGADARRRLSARLWRGDRPPAPAAEPRRRLVPRPPAPRRAHRQDRERTSDETIAALPESGRGLAIMKACVDDVTMSSGPESGTVVSLQKRIAWRNDAPLAHLADDQLRDVG
jgi:hypothetical protein